MAVAAAMLAPPAQAAVLGGRNNPDAEGTSFSLTASRGEANRVTLSRVPGRIVFTNLGGRLRVSTGGSAGVTT